MHNERSYISSPYVCQQNIKTHLIKDVSLILNQRNQRAILER